MDFNDHSQEQPPSKTRRKMEMQALQELGAQLTKFSEAQLERLTLSDKLRNAIREFRRLPNSNEARRRQMQFIGRLMRDLELEEIRSEIENLLKPPRNPVEVDHALEKQCDNILLIGDEAINKLLLKQVHLERQLLRKYFLDYHKAQRTNNESASHTARNKLKAYLKAELN